VGCALFSAKLRLCLGDRTTADRISLLEAHNQQIERLPSAVQGSSEVKNYGDRAVVHQGNLHVGAEDAGFDVGAEVTQGLHHGAD
jgi:hypothetical protein